MSSSFGPEVASSLARRGGMLLALALLLSGCVSSSTSTSSATGGGGNLTVRLQGDWNTFDPSGPVIPAGPAQEIIMGTYDRLIEDQQNGGAVPQLAKSWKTPDASTFLFQLRSDVQCTDGTPLTATNVAKSFTRLFNGGNVAFEFPGGTPTISADDVAHTVQFKWPQPNADALYYFGTAYASVICPAGMVNATALDNSPSGTGPYTITSATHGVSVTLTKNPAWKWGPLGLTAKDLPDSLSFIVISSDTTAANELITGAIDVAPVQGPDVTRLLSNKLLQHISTPSFKLSPLYMNATPGHATAGPQVRRAIMTAIDPSAWNQAAFGGRGVTSTSVFSKQTQCYASATSQYMPRPSLATAKQILLADGYTAGADGRLSKGGKDLSLTVIGTPVVHGQGTDYIASQLTSLGANVTLADLDRATWVVRLRSGNYDVTMGTGGAAPNVPSAGVQLFSGPIPPKGTNFSYSVDPTVDADLTAALNADEASRCQAWAKYQVDLLKDYDILPLAATPLDLFTRAKIALVDVQGLFDTASLRRVA